jgi:HSP20 family protein
MGEVIKHIEPESPTLVPRRSFLSPFEEMEHWFEEVMPSNWLRPFHRTRSMELPLFEARVPAVDVIDRDKEIVLRAELPGVKKDDIEVTVTERYATLRASAAREEKEEKGQYYRHETCTGSFERSVLLPSEVESDKARAQFKDGILEVTLPKLAGTQRRNVKVE